MSEISKLDQSLIIKKIDKETVNVQITDNEMLVSIVGQFNQNLKLNLNGMLTKIISRVIKVILQKNKNKVKGKKIMLDTSPRVILVQNVGMFSVGKDLNGYILIIDLLNLNFRKVKFNKRKKCKCS